MLHSGSLLLTAKLLELSIGSFIKIVKLILMHHYWFSDSADLKAYKNLIIIIIIMCKRLFLKYIKQFLISWISLL